jgi:hypothetical protein
LAKLHLAEKHVRTLPSLFFASSSSCLPPHRLLLFGSSPDLLLANKRRRSGEVRLASFSCSPPSLVSFSCLLLLLASLVSVSCKLLARLLRRRHTPAHTEKASSKETRERGEREQGGRACAASVSLGESAGDEDRETHASLFDWRCEKKKKAPVCCVTPKKDASLFASCFGVAARHHDTRHACRCVSPFCQETSSDRERRSDTPTQTHKRHSHAHDRHAHTQRDTATRDTTTPTLARRHKTLV